MTLRVGRDELTAEVDVTDHRCGVRRDDPVRPAETEAEGSFVVVPFDLRLIADRFCVEVWQRVPVNEVLVEPDECTRGALLVLDNRLGIVFQCGEASATDKAFHP